MLDISAEKTWKRPFVNAGKLLVGRGVQGILSIAYLAFATRTLGAVDFGVLTLIHSSTLLLRHVLGFQSWQMILRYGANALETKNTLHIKKLISFAFSIEFLAAMVGVIGLWLYAGEVVHQLHIYDELAPMVRIYALMLIVLLMSDVGLGILRLTDRHDLISWQVTIEPIIRFFGAGYLFLNGGTLLEFIWVWFIAGMISRAGLIVIALWNLASHIKTFKQDADVENLAIPPIEKGKFKAPQKGIWKYVFGTNLDYGLSLGINQLGPVLIGIVLGAGPAGLYRVAQQFSNIIGHPISKMLLPAIYTDMTWLNTKGGASQRRQMVMRTGLIAGGIATAIFLILVVFGHYLIDAIAGVEFHDAYGVMLVLVLASAVTAISFALEPLLMTAGKVREVITARLVSTVAYVLFMVWLADDEMFGLMGAGYALLGRAVVFMLIAWVYGRKLMGPEAAQVTAESTKATK